MNRKILIPITAAVAVLGFTANANATDHTATCDSLTVTAPAGTRAIVGLDAEPPYEVVETTKTFPFFQFANEPTVTHWYSVTLIDLATGAQLDFTVDQIDNCSTVPFVVSEPVTGPPVRYIYNGDPAPEPEAEVILDPVTTGTSFAQLWAHVELAPPW